MIRVVIAPHVDDDVIGCGGILDRDTIVYYCGVEERNGVSLQQRVDEALAVAKETGHEIVWGSRGNEVNRFFMNNLIGPFEQLINDAGPEEVLLPWPSYNQDHQAVYSAALVALRPQDRNHFVPRVLLYEEPDCFWPGAREPFKPHLFRVIDVKEKLRRYELMESQVRSHRSPEMIEALAAIRGAAIMEPFAEAYHVMRWVE